MAKKIKKKPLSGQSLRNSLAYCVSMTELLHETKKEYSRSEYEDILREGLEKHFQEQQREIEAQVSEPIKKLCLKYDIKFQAGGYGGQGDRTTYDFFFLKEAPNLLEFTNRWAFIFYRSFFEKYKDLSQQRELLINMYFERAYYMIIAAHIRGDMVYTVEATKLDFPPSFCANILEKLYDKMFIEEILHLIIKDTYVDEDGLPKPYSHDMIDPFVEGISIDNFTIEPDVLKEKAEIEKIFIQFDKELGMLL